MATLKFEIDTDEIYKGYDEDGEYGTSFEDLVRQAIGQEVKVKMQSKFAGEAFNSVSKNIALECVWQVEKKLHNLINEDIVMQDRWGKPEFIGSVEDYIKKQIDNKLMRPVNKSGEVLSGCSIGSNNKTWIEYQVERTIEDHMERTISLVVQEVDVYCKSKLDSVLDEFKSKSLNRIIMDRLNAVGVGE